MPKNQAIDLLQYICTYQSGDKKSKPDYLYPFLGFVAQNMHTYQ